LTEQFVPVKKEDTLSHSSGLRSASLSSKLRESSGLALALMSYVVTGFLINPDWSQLLWSTVILTLPQGHAMWGTLLAFLGTTISPYLFYWQSSQEVEEEKSKGAETS
jgi:hypothetical protein